MAEQRTDELARVADTVLLMSAGNVVAAGSPREVLSHPTAHALGVAEPAAVALRRRLRAAGFDPELVGVDA
jgi:ABC-type molybdate transport system ATPase subunit